MQAWTQEVQVTPTRGATAQERGPPSRHARAGVAERSGSPSPRPPHAPARALGLGAAPPRTWGAASTPPTPLCACRLAAAPGGERLWTPEPWAANRLRSGCSMLRAAALAARGLGPRLGRRLLSAATQVVPTPNRQPEVFYNQVRPRPEPPRFVLSGGRGTAR